MRQIRGENVRTRKSMCESFSTTRRADSRRLFIYNTLGSGGLDRLEFRELAAESDGSGPFIDNVSLISASPDAPSLALRPDLTEEVLESPDLPTRPTPEPEPEGIPGIQLLGTAAGETLTGTADDDTLNGGDGDERTWWQRYFRREQWYGHT